VTSTTWEAEVSARRQLQHNLDGKVAARFVARELEVGLYKLKCMPDLTCQACI
jgi:hypothetical protein